jgi:hypothetical protein
VALNNVSLVAYCISWSVFQILLLHTSIIAYCTSYCCKEQSEQERVHLHASISIYWQVFSGYNTLVSEPVITEFQQMNPLYYYQVAKFLLFWSLPRGNIFQKYDYEQASGNSIWYLTETPMHTDANIQALNSVWFRFGQPIICKLGNTGAINPKQTHVSRICEQGNTGSLTIAQQKPPR